MFVDEFIHTFAGERTLSLLRCMAVANGKATLLLEATGYASGERLGDYNHKWNKPCFHDIAHIADTVTQNGHKIIVDADYAVELFGRRKDNAGK